MAAPSAPRRSASLALAAALLLVVLAGSAQAWLTTPVVVTVQGVRYLLSTSNAANGNDLTTLAKAQGWYNKLQDAQYRAFCNEVNSRMGVTYSAYATANMCWGASGH